MFIDDEIDLVDIANQMLEKLGYNVTSVVGSTEAFNLLTQTNQHFDLVITDLNMPGMTGYQLAQELMQLRPDLPVILCSGFSENMEEHKKSYSNIKEFITKPLSMDSLANAVREVLDK